MTRTIAHGGMHEIEIRKSRFICSVERTADAPSAQAFIDATRKRFWDASHNCTAVRIGERGSIQRSSDDGEPSGTAGLPMLEVLRKQDLIDLTAVVSRYFGGTMLGAGGLIRAYGQAISTTILNVGIIERQARHRLEVRIGHDLSGRIEHAIRTSPHELAEVVYGDRKVTFVLYLAGELLPVVEAWIAELTNGRATVNRSGVTCWIDVPVDDRAGVGAAKQ